MVALTIGMATYDVFAFIQVTFAAPGAKLPSMPSKFFHQSALTPPDNISREVNA